MSTATLNHPAGIEERLDEIDGILAVHINELESAALDWFRQRRARAQEWARVYVQTDGPAHVRKTQADSESLEIGLDEEARYEAKRQALRALETRANIGMSLLRAQSRL
jgi:hypothetical protein